MSKRNTEGLFCQTPVMPSLRVDKYNVIYVDPPWKIKAGRPLKGYKMENGKQLFIPTSNKSRDTEYPSMTIDQIKALKVFGYLHIKKECYLQSHQ